MFRKNFPSQKKLHKKSGSQKKLHKNHKYTKIRHKKSYTKEWIFKKNFPSVKDPMVLLVDACLFSDQFFNSVSAYYFCKTFPMETY